MEKRRWNDLLFALSGLSALRSQSHVINQAQVEKEKTEKYEEKKEKKDCEKTER